MSSWPFLFAAALAIWLLLKGPAAKTPLFVQKVCRIAIVFFAYCGFLYLLRWNPFWEWMLALGFENRNKAEGFLILVSTLVHDAKRHGVADDEPAAARDITQELAEAVGVRALIDGFAFEVDNGHEMSGLNHFDLLGHPTVYELLRSWITRRRAPVAA